MAEILLEADHVGLAYHELDGETLAVEDISFAVEKGEFLSIVGPSGCGKTSILSMIDGLMQPSRGRINLYRKSRPAYMLQRRNAGIYQQPAEDLWPFGLCKELSPAAFRRHAAEGGADTHPGLLPGAAAAG